MFKVCSTSPSRCVIRTLMLGIINSGTSVPSSERKEAKALTPDPSLASSSLDFRPISLWMEEKFDLNFVLHFHHRGLWWKKIKKNGAHQPDYFSDDRPDAVFCAPHWHCLCKHSGQLLKVLQKLNHFDACTCKRMQGDKRIFRKLYNQTWILETRG